MEENITKKDYTLPVSILIAAIFISGAWIYSTSSKSSPSARTSSKTTAGLLEEVAPVKGYRLPINWDDLGQKLARAGVIDDVKFEKLMTNRGVFDETAKKMLYGSDNKKIIMTPANANTLLNLFWALGLSNKNEILEKGPMSDPVYGGAERFASTGGWTIAKGNAMDHFSKHNFLNLTEEQQKRAAEASQNIYRPCCNNPTHFPDCNHGLAMLGLLELMASQDVGLEDMYKAALAVNSYWFPEQYSTIAKYLASKNIKLAAVSPEKILGSSFSSASGFEQIQNKTAEPQLERGGGSCGV